MSSVGDAVWNLARLALRTGQYQEAEKALDQAEQSALRDFGQRHVNYASVLQMKAKLKREMGDARGALALLQHALEILRTAPGCPEEMLAGGMNNLAFVFQSIGQYREAEKYFQQARDLTRSSSTVPGRQCYTSTLANLAELFNEIGQDERAEPLLVEALKLDRRLYPPDHPDLATSLHNLGVFRMSHGRVEDGAPLLKEAQDIIAAALGTHSQEYARGLSVIAHALRQSRDYAKAETYCVFALETLRKTRPEKSPEIAGMLADLALVYACRGKFDHAEGALRNALRVFDATLPRDHMRAIEARLSLFAVLAAQGKGGEAFPVLRDAMAAESGVMDTILRLGSEKDRLGYLSSLQWHVEAALAFIVQNGISEHAIVKWGFEMISRRRGLAAEALSVQRDRVHQGDSDLLKCKLSALNAIKMEIAHLLIDPQPNGMKQKKLAHLREERFSLERELADAIPEIGLKLRLEALSSETIAAALPPSAVLLEFFRYSDWHFDAVMARDEKLRGPVRYAVFVLAPGDPPKNQLVNLGEAAPIESAIDAFRACLVGDGTRGANGKPTRFSFAQLAAMIPTKRRHREKQLADCGQAIARLVIEPISKNLEGKKNIVIVPDGQLLWLPFDCLPRGSGYWMDDREITYLNTSRELLPFTADSAASPAAPLVIAAPAYESRANAAAIPEGGRHSRALDDITWRFAPLEGTRMEGEEVGKILGVPPLMGAAATVSAIRQARSPTILHIATHGYFCEPRSSGAREESPLPWAVAQLAAQDNPMLRSGLALAGANSFLDRKGLSADAGLGILTAEDVTGLNLEGTQLVVLSACDTGLGEVVSGEGVFGFRRAFNLAGARILVVSLWKVADDETRELMQIFYKRLLQAEGPQTALHRAKIQIREKHRDPYFWAAFICCGSDAAGNKS